MQETIWEAYGGEVVVLAVGPADELSSLQALRDDLGLTFPVLWDEGGRVHTAYELVNAYADTFYPEEYLIDASGQIVYVSNAYEPEVLKARIDELL